MSYTETRYFEDIAVGEELPSLWKEIGIEQMAMYAAVCWDFQPAHYDSAAAQAQGFRTAYVDGPMVAGFMAQLITDWAGKKAQLKKIVANYRVMVFPGDRLVCKGKVTGLRTEAGANLVDCEVWTENQKGERPVYGTAIVSLPSRGKEVK